MSNRISISPGTCRIYYQSLNHNLSSNSMSMTELFFWERYIELSDIVLLMFFLQRSFCHTYIKAKWGVCVGTLTVKGGMTGWSQMVPEPGAFKSLERAGECKYQMDVRMRPSGSFDQIETLLPVYKKNLHW